MPIIHKKSPVEINNPGSDAGGKTGSKKITDKEEGNCSPEGLATSFRTQ